VVGTCECGNEPSGSIMTSCKPVSFSRRTLLHGVSITAWCTAGGGGCNNLGGLTLAPLLLSSSFTIKLNLPVAKLEGNEAITVWQRRHTLQTRSLMFVSRLLPRGKKHKHSDSRRGVHWSDQCHFQHLNLQAFFSQYTA
jgi:hypothetical protein